MKTLKVSAILLALFTITFLSCKKDESKSNTPQPTTELSTTVQVSVADDQVNEGLITAMDEADGTEDGGADIRPLNCAIVITNNDMKTISIDFGNGCTNPNTGKTRSGKIIVGFTGDNYETATQRTIQFVNYKTVDSVTLNGTFTQNNLVRTDNAVSFTLTASDFTFLFAGGKTHTLVSYNRIFMIDLGHSLRDFSDNTTTISGSTTGVNKEGEAYSVNIITPVVFKGECFGSQVYYPASGAYDIKIGNKPKFNLSWGTGICDKIVTITYLGVSADIALQ